MATSYKVSVPYYEGAPSVSDRLIPEIAPKEIKSMQSLPISYFNPHFIGGKAVTRTANNVYPTSLKDYAKRGYFSQPDDFQIRGFEEAGENNPPSRHNLIPPKPDVAYIVGTPKPMDLKIEDTPVNLYTTPVLVNAVPPNKEGKYASKIRKLEQDLRNLLWNETYNPNFLPRAMIEFLTENGLPIKNTQPLRGVGGENDVKKE